MVIATSTSSFSVTSASVMRMTTRTCTSCTLTLLLLVLLQQSQLSYSKKTPYFSGGKSPRDYLYTNEEDFDRIHNLIGALPDTGRSQDVGTLRGIAVKGTGTGIGDSGGDVPIKQAHNDPEVWPIEDYVKPKQGSMESDGDYDKRVKSPEFLGDGYNRPRVVYFYAPWCGHCKRHKPHYIRLGKDTFRLNPMIDFFAVSCIAHQPICQENRVTDFPKLKFFPENSSEGIIIEDYGLDAKAMNEKYFIKHSTLAAGGTNSGSSSENNNSSGGGGGGSISNNLDAYAHVKAHDHDNVNHARKRVSHLKERGDKRYTDKKASLLSSSPSSSSEGGVALPNDVYINAASSFQFALHSSIFMTLDELSQRQSETFNKWLTLVRQTLPSSPLFSFSSGSTTTTTTEPVMKTTLLQADSLLSNFNHVTQDEVELLEQLNKVEKENGDNKEISEVGNEQWTHSCSKGIAHEGYTCGLWHLFHIVTIGLVHYNIEQEGTDKLLSTMKAADTIRDYIQYFFTCNECRVNFLKMYEECRFDRCNRLKSLNSNDDNNYTIEDWKQLALWLWETHNDVNVRLLREERIGSDSQSVSAEEENEVRWPSKSECPKCWLDGGGWNEDIVYEYLDSFYWPKLPVADEL